ncbi:PE family protein [Actinomycetospora succinea]|uniref:PE family protein n=1 Tax=Actinomycetospora succinea TaxID=663603 RepID=A0A4R6VED9_9PSEU|nr:PE domain-containing protein [Actinomycetospora succinea]TDQ61132.1 PE family protein [Actinomycetospora succinea]
MTDPLPPPLEADSPASPPDGSTVPRYRPPEVGGGTFTVDLAQAPQAIRELEDAARELSEIRREAERLGKIDPPAADLVSRDAANVLGAAAAGGSGSFVAALDSGILQIQNMITALQTAMTDYSGTDARNAAALRQR